MRKVFSVFCVLAFITFALFANSLISPKADSVNFPLVTEAAEVENSDDWNFGFLVARAKCSGKKIKVVTQVFEYCPKDESISKILENHKGEINSGVASVCGTEDFKITSSYSGVGLTKESAEKLQKKELKKESCTAGCDTVQEIRCSCKRYSSKCK